MPAEVAAGTVASRCNRRPNLPSRGEPAQAPLEVGRDEGQRQRDRQRHEPDHGRHERQGERVAPGNRPQCRPKPQTMTAKTYGR